MKESHHLDSAGSISAVTLQQSATRCEAQWQHVTVGSQCHSAAEQCQLNVSGRSSTSSWHASVPLQRPLGVGASDCFQAYAGSSMMGNRLADCAVAGVSATTTEHNQSVPTLIADRSYRDYSQWPQVPSNSAPVQFSKGMHWPPTCGGVNRTPWFGLWSPTTVNRIDTRHNYAPEVYDQRPTNQCPPGNVPAGRFPAANVSSIQQMWMPVRPHQQQAACHNTVSMSPIHSASVIGQSSTSPVVWRPRYASQSLCSLRLSGVAQTECTTAVSSAQSCHVTSPSFSPVISSAVRNNTVGLIYQLPTPTAAVTTVYSHCEPAVLSSASTCVSSSTTVSVITTTKSVINLQPVVKAVITPSQPQPETERTYVAGRRYTVTKENGVTVEGIWDGKYLTVLTTTSADTAASQRGWLLLYLNSYLLN